MKLNYKIGIGSILIIILIGIFQISRAREIALFPQLTKNDRILILAPHPDDETIATGGIIQQTMKVGARLKIVCFTNGDHNQWAFIADTKRIPLRQKEFLFLGGERRNETISAMTCFGVTRNNLVFLGYPDFGTLRMFTEYWNTSKPYRAWLTRISKVPYPDALSPNAPYFSESILKDLKTVLMDFKPTKIFVSHPADTNPDHRALYLFLRVALWDLDNKIPKPEIYPFLIHGLSWPQLKGYHPELVLIPPDNLPEVRWQQYRLTPEEVKLKDTAISMFKSQFRQHLYPFLRNNELFGDYPIVTLSRQTMQRIVWQDLDVITDTASFISTPIKSNQKNVADIEYGWQGDKLLIQLHLKRVLDEELGISIYLFGHDKKIEFARMPKIRVTLGILGVQAFDLQKHIVVSGTTVNYEKQMVIISVPLAILGNPKYILSSAYSRAGDFLFTETAWRILALE